MSKAEIFFASLQSTLGFLAFAVAVLWCVGLIRVRRNRLLAQDGAGWISIRTDGGFPEIDRIFSRDLVRSSKEWDKVVALKNGDREALVETGAIVVVGSKSNGGGSTMRPVRLQRKNTAGWKMIEGAIYIGTGSKYENPFDSKVVGKQKAVQNFRLLMGEHGEKIWPELIERRAEILELLPELKNKNLVDWAKITEPSHGDWYLKHANV
jgi:hypothetical protein